MLKILLTTPAMVTTQVVIWLLVVTLLVITPAFAGDKEFKRCKSCHSIEQDGKNKIGPNLWNIFNRGTAQFRAWAEENPVWTPELMDQWLTKSTKLVKGTKMRFREKKQEKRAATIVYLQSMQEVEK
jgi:cytochrome c